MGFDRSLECLQSIAHFLDLFRDHLVLFGRNIGRCEQHAGGLAGAIYKQTKGKQCPAFEGCAHGAAWLGLPSAFAGRMPVLTAKNPAPTSTTSVKTMPIMKLPIDLICVRYLPQPYRSNGAFWLTPRVC